MAQFHQDWTANVVENKSNQYKQRKSAQEAASATSGKKKRRKNKSKQSDLQKAEAEESNFAVQRVDLKFSVALQRARIAKGWKQEDLAQRLNVHKTIVNQYESGKAIPSSQLVALMNRILGCKLPPINKPGGGKKKKKSKNKNKK